MSRVFWISFMSFSMFADWHLVEIGPLQLRKPSRCSLWIIASTIYKHRLETRAKMNWWSSRRRFALVKWTWIRGHENCERSSIKCVCLCWRFCMKHVTYDFNLLYIYTYIYVYIAITRRSILDFQYIIILDIRTWNLLFIP